MTTQVSPILIIEDNFRDAISAKQVFKDLKIANPLVVLSNREDALAYLQDVRQERPTFILTDLHLPGIEGLELLTSIKQNSRFRDTPIIALISFPESQAREHEIDGYIDAYIEKPIHYIQLVETVRQIQLFWTLREVV